MKTDPLRESASLLGRRGQESLSRNFKSPQEKSAYFKELSKKAMIARLEKGQIKNIRG